VARLFVIYLIFCSASLAQDLAISGAQIIDGTGVAFESGSIVVGDGRVVSISEGDAESSGPIIDARGLTAVPGNHRYTRTSDYKSGHDDGRD